MNEYDSKRVSHQLSSLGYSLNDDIGVADIIVLNTCSIRQKAEDKVYSMLGRLRPYKEKNPDLIIAVGGCVAQQVGKKILGRHRHVNLVFGTKNVLNLKKMIEKIEKTGGRYVDVGANVIRDDTIDEKMDGYMVGAKNSVTIIEGCNNFCAYCIVPYVRGRERSRPEERILHEVRTLIKHGAKEVTLLGQNVNSYKDAASSSSDFPKLLDKVAAIDGLERLRIMTSHPKDLTDELIDRFGAIDKLCNNIHLPVQSGSNSVLKSMNRNYTREDYLSKVEKLQKVCNNITISTDLIVGFPSESKKDFNDTLALLRQVRYISSFSFKYSVRPGTKAASFDDDVSNSEKSERLEELQTLQKKIQLEENKKLEKRVMEILVEGASKSGENMITGRTTCNRVVNFTGDESLTGKIVSVNIEESYLNSLLGKLV